MTCNGPLEYCPLLMEGWQHKAAFVIQFRPETDIEAGRFEGRIEHVASTRASDFTRSTSCLLSSQHAD